MIPNLTRSPAVDRVMTVHNGIAHVVEVYGRQLAELSAENHAVRAELMAKTQDQATALKAKDETILQLQQELAGAREGLRRAAQDMERFKLEVEEKFERAAKSKDLASFDQCG